MENQISCLLSTQKENCRESRHREILEELPLNREHQKKKVKANTSRKSSVGKIISQNVAGAEHK